MRLSFYFSSIAWQTAGTPYTMWKAELSRDHLINSRRIQGSPRTLFCTQSYLNVCTHPTGDTFILAAKA